MSVVEMPPREEPSAAFGDDLLWYPDDTGPRRFNPVTDIRILRPGERRYSPELVEAIVEEAMAAIATLQHLDPDDLDAETTSALAVGLEQIRRQADAAATTVVGHIDAAQPFRSDGWFTAKRWAQHALQLSGPEAHNRVQAARFFRRIPLWAEAQSAGQVGVAQVRVMASIAANPRIGDDVLERSARDLLIDAMYRPFDEFERLARTWEMLADPLGAAEQAERNRLRRTASIRPRHDGGWDVHAVLDDIAGAEFQEVLAHYIDAEFTTDWAEATERLGDGNVSMGVLRRTQPQRCADALVAIARAAAATPPHANRPVPTVNVIIDEATLAATIEGVPIDPARYGDLVCRTERGHRLHPVDAANTALWGMIRRVVVDSAGVVIDLGRRSRLFVGSARTAVMLLEETCVWIGCDLPHDRCHADHMRSWSARGPTRPDNGCPLCPRHNYLKEQGFTVTRDRDGTWHTFAPDGRELR